MKKFTQLMVAALLLAGISSCTSSMKVTSDYDKTANFSQYKSFKIDTLSINQRISQLNADRLIRAVKAQMQAKGYMEDVAAPDLLVSIATILKDKQSVTSNTDFYGYGGMYRPYGWSTGMGVSGYTTYNVDNYKDGSLIIDVADSRGKKLIWEGIGNKEIDKPIEDPDTAIPAAVSSIMASFPAAR